MIIYLLSATGGVSKIECAAIMAMDTIKSAIGADILDTVNLRDGRLMLVDDQGHEKELPINANATRFYLHVTRRGTSHVIRGDVAIARDADFERATHVTGFRQRDAPELDPVVIPASGASETETPYRVHCREHGDVCLTEAEYDRQMYAADATWVCPTCFGPAIWDDEWHEEQMDKLTAPATEKGDDTI